MLFDKRHLKLLLFLVNFCENKNEMLMNINIFIVNINRNELN